MTLVDNIHILKEYHEPDTICINMKRTHLSKRQEEIDELMYPLMRDLNRVIRGTVEYVHGKFRFRVRQDASGEFNFMVADSAWIKQYDKIFRRIAYEHGYHLKCNLAKGIYHVYQIPDREQEDYDQYYSETLVQGNYEKPRTNNNR